MTQLCEQYRPAQWSDVVGQSKALERIETLRQRVLGGRAFFISGALGTGKTTIARLLASEVADDLNTTELTARGLTPAKLEETHKATRTFGLGQRNGHAVIINEVHGLSRGCIEALLVILEDLPSHVVWVFTTTTDNQEKLFDEESDAAPWASRCQMIPLARRDLAKAFAERARWIAQREGLDGRPIEAYVKLVQKHRQNLRAVLQDIEAGVMKAGGE